MDVYCTPACILHRVWLKFYNYTHRGFSGFVVVFYDFVSRWDYPIVASLRLIVFRSLFDTIASILDNLICIKSINSSVGRHIATSWKLSKGLFFLILQLKSQLVCLCMQTIRSHVMFTMPCSTDLPYWFNCKSKYQLSLFLIKQRVFYFD